LRNLLLLALCALVSSCATPASVTPRADLTPIKTSNAETRREIASTKKSIEKAKESNVKGATSLDEAIKALESLLK
jgi:hypothetical protein